MADLDPGRTRFSVPPQEPGGLPSGWVHVRCLAPARMRTGRNKLSPSSHLVHTGTHWLVVSGHTEPEVAARTGRARRRRPCTLSVMMQADTLGGIVHKTRGEPSEINQGDAAMQAYVRELLTVVSEHLPDGDGWGLLVALGNLDLEVPHDCWEPEFAVPVAFVG